MTRLCRTLGLALLMPALARAETCRFTGTTTGDGTLAVTVSTTQEGDLVTVDATASFAISSWLSDFRYYGQEISTWRGGALQSLAVNQRTLADDRVTRQQWDVFTRVGDHLQARRAQAKRLAEFREHYPVFAAHWPLGRFGQPWLAEFPAADAERRPDLDLPVGPGTRTPMALAFHWSRALAPAGGDVPVVLPGFKRDVTTALRFGPAVDGPGWRRWSIPLAHPALASRPASLAAAWISPDGYLLQLSLDVHNSLASGQATLRAQGCQGVQIRPG